MTEMAILNDVTKCMGCRACQTACKQWNELPAEATSFAATGSYQNPADLSSKTWNLVQFNEWEDAGNVNWAFSRRSCLHCSDAACIDICPADAINRTEEGFVIIDKDECLECGMCPEACPFDVPHLGSTARKCTSCIERVKNGLEPSCVAACSNEALIYGEREQLLEQAREISARDPDWQVYGEEELEGLHVIYVLPEKSERFELSRSPQPGGMVYLLKALKYCLPGTMACRVSARLLNDKEKKNPKSRA